MKKILQCLCYILIFATIWFYGMAIINHEYNLLLLAAFTLWIHNVLYACKNFKERTLFFFFHITLFFFLLGRPVIYFFQGINWVEQVTKYYLSSANVWLGVEIIWISLGSILLGSFLGTMICKRVRFHIKSMEYYKNSFFAFNLRWISLMIFTVSLLCTIVLGIEKVQFIIKHSYAEYFILFSSKNPYIVSVLSSFLIYSLCLYLATFPPKFKVYPVLILYVLSTMPTLVVGERNPFAISIIFSLIYFIFRDYNQDNIKWLGKIEKTALILATPIGLCALGLLNYTRDNLNVKFGGVGAIITDLIVRQGVSFAWLCSGLGSLNAINTYPGINFTFGSFIDYFKYGRLGEKFFGISLGSGNTLLKATKSNSMAHHLSYTLLGEQYLQGHGSGSSYLLEVYADYKIIGIIIFSVLLGLFLSVALKFARQGIIPCAFILLSVSGVLLMPRAEALGAFYFTIQLPFWCAILACMVGGSLFYRKYRK